MAVLKKKKEREAKIPDGSLADIAFLILIFFMVATTIDMDKGIGLILPPDSEEEVKLNKDMITNVLIDPKGNVFLDGETVDVDRVRTEVEKLLAKNPKMIFSIKAHESAKYEDYISVLDQLKMAKADKNISIAQ
ncbi:MAG: biopolymer transporter ExbD [Candidatus Marinimicrobia bacterium]|nr:biopolymer transporter ExbD [Candidatus Neomarinimicrobiota bacterium]